MNSEDHNETKSIPIKRACFAFQVGFTRHEQLVFDGVVHANELLEVDVSHSHSNYLCTRLFAS